MTIGHYIMPHATYSRDYSSAEKARLELFFERSNPSPLLFLQDFDWCLRTKKKYPDRLVFFREGYGKEEMPDEYGDANSIYNRLVKFTDYGVIPQVYNEPPGYNQESLIKQVSVQIELANRFAKHNLQVSMGSWSVGNPDDHLYHILKPLFEAIHSYHHILNLHEYGTYRGMQYFGGDRTSDVYPYRVGRFTWIVKYCVDNNISIPTMFFSEWAIDSSQYANDNHDKRGYKDSRNVRDYAHELIDCWMGIYQSFANVLGTAVYCIGNNGKKGSAKDWRSHDVFNNDSGAINEDYLEIMEAFYRGDYGLKQLPLPIPDNPVTGASSLTLSQTIQLLQKHWPE